MNQIQKYITYEQLSPLNQFQNKEELFTYLENNLNSNNWQNQLDGLTILRTINKYHSNEIFLFVENYQLRLLKMLNDPKTTLNKSILIFLQELFFTLKHNIPANIISEFEPVIIQLVFSNKNMIKREAQTAFELMVTECISDVLIQRLSESSINKNINIASLSLQALERVIIKIKANLNLLQENTFIYIFKALAIGLESKKQQLYKIAKNITKTIFTITGKDNFVNFVIKLINTQILIEKDMKNFEDCFKDKNTKDIKVQSDELKNMVKTGREHMKNMKIYSDINSQNSY